MFKRIRFLLVTALQAAAAAVVWKQRMASLVSICILDC